MNIQTDRFVEIAYRILDDEGGTLEECEASEPVHYVHGSGQILPGLEQALEGRAAGASFEVTLEPEEAYGDYDVGGLISVPRSEFPPDAELVPGDWITVHVSDDDEPHSHGPDESCEDELEMRVVEISPESIVLDANHPLAGKTVTFSVEVVSVREATADELSRARDLADEI